MKIIISCSSYGHKLIHLTHTERQTHPAHRHMMTHTSFNSKPQRQAEMQSAAPCEHLSEVEQWLNSLQWRSVCQCDLAVKPVHVCCK